MLRRTASCDRWGPRPLGSQLPACLSPPGRAWSRRWRAGTLPPPEAARGSAGPSTIALGSGLPVGLSATVRTPPAHQHGSFWVLGTWPKGPLGMCNEVSPCPCLAVALCPCCVLGHPGPRGACRVEGTALALWARSQRAASRAGLSSWLTCLQENKPSAQPAAGPLQGGAGGRCPQQGWGQHCCQKGRQDGLAERAALWTAPWTVWWPRRSDWHRTQGGHRLSLRAGAGERAWSQEGSGSNIAATAP